MAPIPQNVIGKFQLKEAVFAAFSWKLDLSDEGILENAEQD